MSVTLAQAYTLFLADRETSCVAETIQYYSENLMNFFSFCDTYFGRSYDKVLCAEMNKDVFRDYIVFLRNKSKFQNHPYLDGHNEPLSGTSIRTYARSIKVFANYCKDNGFCDNFTYNVKLPKDDHKDIIPLYQSEVSCIDKCFNIKTVLGCRNWCIFHLMLDAGLRSSEVVELRFCDVFYDKRIIRVWKAKGSKTRLVIMCPRLKSNILRYCTLYRQDHKDSDFVFVKMNDGFPINGNVIKQLFARLKRKSGVERLYPHLLRHTFATSYIVGGGNLEMLRLLLGHSDYDVTKVYLHLAQQCRLLRSDIYRLDPVFFEKYL